MSEEAPIGPTIGTVAVSAKGNVLEKVEVSVATDTSIEGFFNGADVITEAIASAIVVATREDSAKALVPQSEPIFPWWMFLLRRRFLRSFPLFLLSFPLP